jgi:hypothetical protein
VRQLLADGLSPERVAEVVVGAIREERLYVLTHPEWKGMIRQRLEDIMEGRAPALGTMV